MDALDVLVGEWRMEVSFSTEGVAARAVFERILDGQFLVQRAEVDHPDAPNSFAVISPDSGGDGYTQHYFDSRGVVRVYAMTLSDGVWTLLRDSPDFSPLSFSQRFTGTFSDDGNTIDARWEQSDDGSNWELDFEMTYTRVG
jgi:hypothetical protein